MALNSERFRQSVRLQLNLYSYIPTKWAYNPKVRRETSRFDTLPISTTNHVSRLYITVSATPTCLPHRADRSRSYYSVLYLLCTS